VTTATTMPLPPRGQLNRADKVMSADEIDAFLTTSFCGRTATIGADGYPYVVPNLFVWHDSTVFLHTTRHPGHFAANVKNSDRISCSRLRRSSSASLRTAAAEAATPNPARRPGCRTGLVCLSGVRSARFRSRGPGCHGTF
jgi:hypothetical protein